MSTDAKHDDACAICMRHADDMLGSDYCIGCQRDRLLDACRSALASLESQRKYIADDIQAAGHNADARAALQSAITKAEGATHV